MKMAWTLVSNISVHIEQSAGFMLCKSLLCLSEKGCNPYLFTSLNSWNLTKPRHKFAVI